MVVSLLVMPTAALPAPPVFVEVLYMNHGPLQSTIKAIRGLCDGYGKALTVTWYDFESPEGEKFMAKKGIREHVPLAIWVAGKTTAKVKGIEVQFAGFPSGTGPHSFRGKWTLDDLRGALDLATGKK